MQPVQLHLHSATDVLDITWDDGITTRFALRYLRGWCPCAKCQGHFSGTHRFVDVPGVKLLQVEPVGNYAMRPLWSDGHTSGILAFPYLRALAAAPPAVGPCNDDFLPTDAP